MFNHIDESQITGITILKDDSAVKAFGVIPGTHVVMIDYNGKIDDEMAKRYESLEQKDPVELDRKRTKAMVEKISLRQAICNLSEREATVIRLRYFHGLTQQRVAKVLDVSQVQVSRIEKKAITILRQLLQES